MQTAHEKIARRAYELFEARGGQNGYHMEDWLQAEKELKTKKAPSAAKKKTAAKN